VLQTANEGFGADCGKGWYNLGAINSSQYESRDYPDDWMDMWIENRIMIVASSQLSSFIRFM
jgi:hypothetical protein